jgi:hypothetical protein
MIQKVRSSNGDFEGLPGAEIVEPGLNDLAAGVISAEALAVALFAPRLRPLGVNVPDCPLPSPQTHALYTLLEDRYGNEAHSRYNALLRRIISFASALEREASAAQARHTAASPARPPEFPGSTT